MKLVLSRMLIVVAANCFTSVESRTATSHVEVRLVGGNATAGRVEVKYKGEWGTICDDFFQMPDARVICRQLDLGDPVRVHRKAYFGKGSGPIFLDNVSCYGHEVDIAQCRHRGFNINNCGHNEDVGVVCSAVTASLNAVRCNRRRNEETGVYDGKLNTARPVKLEVFVRGHEFDSPDREIAVERCFGDVEIGAKRTYQSDELPSRCANGNENWARLTRFYPYCGEGNTGVCSPETRDGLQWNGFIQFYYKEPVKIEQIVKVNMLWDPHDPNYIEGNYEEAKKYPIAFFRIVEKMGEKKTRPKGSWNITSNFIRCCLNEGDGEDGVRGCTDESANGGRAGESEEKVRSGLRNLRELKDMADDGAQDDENNDATSKYRYLKAPVE